MTGIRWTVLLLAGLFALPAAANTPAYEDRLMEGLDPSQDDSETDYRYDASGLPRYLRLETRLNALPSDPREKIHRALGFYGLIETPNHGSISVDGQLSSGQSLGTLTYRQRAIPLPGARLGHIEAGIIAPPVPTSLRQPLRVSLPVVQMRGISAELETPASFGQWSASSGQRGRLVSQPVNAFERDPGSLSTLGGQWQIAPGHDPLRAGTVLSLLHESARGVTEADSASDAPRLDAQSTLLGLSHDGGLYQLHARLLHSTSGGVAGSRHGYWVEGEARQGSHTHGFGAYRLDTDLSWGGQAMASDTTGVFYRHQWRTRQWLSDISLDLLRTLAEPRRQGYYANSSLRWRINRQHTVGAGLTLRDLGTRAWGSYADWRWANALGNSGLRLDLRDSAQTGQPGVYQLTYDQEWRVPQGWSLSTSVGAGHYGAVAERGDDASSFLQLAASVTAPLSHRGQLRASTQSERDNSGEQRHALNLWANWRLHQDWTLEGNYTRNIGSTRILAPLDPLAPPVTQVRRSAERSFYLTVRYELQAGSRSVPLGGRPQEGGGRIEGVIFFDNNRNGTQEASENGAPGVIVSLDNRYTVRTDERGWFVFPFVASGSRTITVRNDSLPLPWAAVGGGETRIDVRLRDTSRLSIPVQREN